MCADYAKSMQESNHQFYSIFGGNKKRPALLNTGRFLLGL
jgi:hypothetical protein